MFRSASMMIACAIMLAIPSSAEAHELVDQGRRLYESANFEGALEALESAENATDLNQSEVIEIFELRALIGLAIENESLLVQSLESLALLDPEHQFGPEVPPTIFERFRALNADPLRLGTRAQSSGTELVIDATVRGADTSELVRRVVIYARIGSGHWSQAIDEPLRISHEGEADIEWYVEVIGPGGAVILNRGSEAEPELEELAPPHQESHQRRRRIRPWAWGVIVGSVVVVASVVAIATVFATRDDEIQTTVSRPTIYRDQ